MIVMQNELVQNLIAEYKINVIMNLLSTIRSKFHRLLVVYSNINQKMEINY